MARRAHVTLIRQGFNIVERQVTHHHVNNTSDEQNNRHTTFYFTLFPFFQTVTFTHVFLNSKYSFPSSRHLVFSTLFLDFLPAAVVVYSIHVIWQTAKIPPNSNKYDFDRK